MDTQPSYQSHENANAAVTATGNANMESFLIDDLLDFSNDEDDADIAAPIEKENSASSVTTESDSSPSGSVASADAANSSSLVTDDLPESMLCVPTDTLADLEWLSTFVDESFTVPEFIPYSTEPSSEYMKKKAKEEKKKEERCRFTASSFPVKARSKRSRTGGRVWSLTYPLLVTNPSYFSNAELFPSGESSESSSSSVGRPPKKQKMKKTAAKKPRVLMEPSSEGSNHPQRKCSHCLVTKTPQWRTGPLGPKTLCNACGVRYKSGRLLPEYRPALSPTFLSHVHSNSHRKILEMRRQKGLPHEQTPHQTLAFLQQNLLQNHRQSLEEQFDDHHDENPLQEIPISQHVAEISHVAEIAPHVTEIAPITPHGVEVTHNVAEMIQQVHEIDQSIHEKDRKQSAEISHEETKKEAVKNYEERFLQHTEHHQQPMAVH